MEGRLPADLKTFPLLISPIVYCLMIGDLDKFTFNLGSIIDNFSNLLGIS